MSDRVGQALRAEISAAPWALPAWTAYGDALRAGTRQYAALRESVIMRVALNRRCAYVWSQHLGRARDAGCPLDRVISLQAGRTGTPPDELESAIWIADATCAGDSAPSAVILGLAEEIRTSLILTSAFYLSVCALVRSLPVVDLQAETSSAMRPWRRYFTQEGQETR